MSPEIPTGEFLSISKGNDEAQQEIDIVNAASTVPQEEMALERQINELLTGLEDDKLRDQLEKAKGSIKKAEKDAESVRKVLKATSKIVTRITKSLGQKADLFRQLDKIDQLPPEKRAKLMGRLKDLTSEQYKQVTTVLKKFMPLAATHLTGETAVMYFEFISSLIIKPDYLRFHHATSTETTQLEKDLIQWSQMHGSAYTEVLKKALIESAALLPDIGSLNATQLNSRFADLDQAAANQTIINQTLTNEALTKRNQGVSVEDLPLSGKIEHYSGVSTGAFEEQRNQKLLKDLSNTLGAIDMTDRHDLEIIGGPGYTAKEFDNDVTNFKLQVGSGSIDMRAEKWVKMTLGLRKLQFELKNKKGADKDADAKIARITTLIDARNALDLVAHGGRIDKFLSMYERHFALERHLAEHNEGEYSGLTPAEKESKILENCSNSFRRTTLYASSNILRGYLAGSTEPTKQYDESVAGAGDAYTNPRELFSQFVNMLSSLTSQASSLSKSALRRSDGTTEYDMLFSVLGRDGMEDKYVDMTGGKSNTPDQDGHYLPKKVTIATSNLKQKKTSIASFIKELSEHAKTDNAFFKAGHEFRYISYNGGQEHPFFESVASHIKSSMTATNIDRIYAMEDSEYISRTTSVIESILQKRLAEKDWKNDGGGKFFEELFSDSASKGTPNLLKSIKGFLDSNYPDLPDWQKQRVMYHSLTMVFAGRFRFQQIFSYSNPTRGFQGQAEDKQMFNGVFSPYQKLFRFPPKWDHDFAQKGAAWLPYHNMPFNYKIDGTQKIEWDPFKMGEEGFEVFISGKHETLGRLAWDMTNYFQDDVPRALQQINVLKAGGYDTLRGWRRYANMGVIDSKLYQYQALGGPPRFVTSYTDPTTGEVKNDGITRLWKSIENVGVNDLQAFVDGDILDYMIKFSDGKLKDEEGLVKFAEFLYKRYLNDADETGHALSHEYLGHGIDPATGRARNVGDFCRAFRDRIREFSKEIKDHESPDQNAAASKRFVKAVMEPMVYDALLVTIGQRMPVEFLYRLRNQDEQNGLTLHNELKAEFFKKSAADFNKKWGVDSDLSTRTKIWDEMTDDLSYVQAELRGEVDDEILKHRKHWQHDSGWSTIYGNDFDKDTSDVNQGKGYVLDDETLARIMAKRLRPEVVATATAGVGGDWYIFELQRAGVPKDQIDRIEHARALRKFTLERMAAKPKLSVGERELGERLRNGKLSEEEEVIGRKTLLQRFERNQQQKRVKRIDWFKKMWLDGYMGSIPFMKDNSEVHKIFLNSDDTLVYRSTGECGVAEKYKEILNPRGKDETNMMEMVKDYLRSGDESKWKPLKSLINGFRKSCSDEIGDPAVFMPVVLDLIKMQLDIMVDKKSVRNAIGKWKSWFDPHGHSLGSEAWTNFKTHGLSAPEIRKFLLRFSEAGGMYPEQVNSFSEMFDATWLDIMKELVPEYITYIMFMVLAAYISEATEKETSK